MSTALAQARAALTNGDPAAALALADRHAAAGQPAWQVIRAQALTAQGQPEAAEAVLRAAGDFLPARLLLGQLLTSELRPEEALACLPRDDARSLMMRLTPLIRLERIPEAREDLAVGIAMATQPLLLERLFRMAAPLFGSGTAHEVVTRHIATRLEAVAGEATNPMQAGAALRLRAQLRFTLGEAEAFRAAAAATLEAGAGEALTAILQSALHPPARPRPRVFVVGLSKTGTTSMDTALGRIGLLNAHWAHPLTSHLLRPRDAALIEAMSDTPVADAVEVLAALHPDARFILTQRPVEDRVRSMVGHYGRFHQAPDMDRMRVQAETPDRTTHGAEWRAIMRSLYTRHPDYPTAYAAHHARVEAAFRDAPNRLLRFDAASGDGYPKLCDFLGLPAPDEPFPHSNAAPPRD